MSHTISDQVIDILVEAGANLAYGVPGDAIDLILSSISKRSDFEFILTRHEESAGFMASAKAKLNGELGIVFACQGPGAAHMLNAMYDAKMDKVPMLVITGQIESHLIGTNTVQELNQILLFDDVAEFNREVRSSDNLIDILQLGIQSAINKRSVSHISIATNVLREKSVNSVSNPALFNTPYHIIPDDSIVKSAVTYLHEANNITILYGGGCLYAKEALLKTAQLLNAPMVHTVRSKDIINNNDPHYVGGIGQKGSHNGCYYVKNCDLLLVVGCSFAWREFYPEDKPIIQIDIDSQRIGVHCKTAVGLIGDANITLKMLNKAITAKKEDSFLQKARSEHKKAIVNLTKKGERTQNDVMTSPYLTSRVSESLAKDAIVTVDAGTVSVWANNWLCLNGKQRLIGSTELGTLGYGMPAAIGCQIAEPDRQVVALCGDGGFQMTMGDFSTAIKYQLPITIIIYNDFSYHFIELEQMKEGVAQSYTKLNNPDYAKLAEAFGGVGYIIEKSSSALEIIKKALSNNKPTIIDARIKHDQLIIPPKINTKMIANFTKGMVKTLLNDR